MNLCREKGYKEQEFTFLSHEINNPRGIIIIAYGVAESAERYNYLASQLNLDNYNVYVINHINHGPYCNSNLLGHWEKHDFDGCLFNINVLYKKLKSQFRHLNFILLGHSMGSFMAQKYFLLYPNDFNGLILSGCAKSDFIFKFGALFSSFLAIFNNKHKRMPIINNLSFASFNKKFKPNKTSCDWLCKDEDICKHYESTKHIGFIATSGFYKEFYTSIAKIPNKAYKKLFSKDFPILLIGGKEDMVSNRGKKLIKLYEFYAKQSNDISYKLFDDDRHEIFNETDKDMVIDYVKTWLRRIK